MANTLYYLGVTQNTWTPEDKKKSWTSRFFHWTRPVMLIWNFSKFSVEGTWGEVPAYMGNPRRPHIFHRSDRLLLTNDWEPFNTRQPRNQSANCDCIWQWSWSVIVCHLVNNDKCPIANISYPLSISGISSWVSCTHSQCYISYMPYKRWNGAVVFVKKSPIVFLPFSFYWGVSSFWENLRATHL